MRLQDSTVLQRRLLLGVAATVALGAFALVPTDSLRLGKPSKPLFLYLIPLIRVQVSCSFCFRSVHQHCACQPCAHTFSAVPCMLLTPSRVCFCEHHMRAFLLTRAIL